MAEENPREARAWYKVNAGKWKKVSLKGIEYVADLETAIHQQMEEPRFHVSSCFVKATMDDWDPENAIELDERDSLASVLANFDITEDTSVKRSFADHIRLFIILPGLLSESDFLKLIPPSLMYISQHTTVGNTRSETFHDPNSVTLWDDFVDNVNNISWDIAPKYSRPISRTRPSTSGKTEVQYDLFRNVLEPLEILLAKEAYFCTHSSMSDVIIGQPDYILRDDSRNLWLVIEVKTKLSLPDSGNNLVEAYNRELKVVQAKKVQTEKKKKTELSVFCHLRQIFGYLESNHLQFGVLTTYDKTWFLSRSRDDPTLLCISPAIRNDNVQPTLFQCFYYLIRQALNAQPLLSSSRSLPSALSNHDNNGDGDYSDKNRTGKRKAQDQGPTRKNPVRKARWAGSLAMGSRSTTQPSHPLGGENDNMALEFFYWRDFQILGLLGAGRSGTVFKAVWREETVALKICDLWKHPDYEKELLDEVAAYRALENLQGVCIPRLKGAGYNPGGLFVIATEIAGRTLEIGEHLNDEEREVIRKALSTIHDHGFVHGDIRGDNVLINRSGKFQAFFIDLTFSEHGDESDFEEEMMALAQLIE